VKHVARDIAWETHRRPHRLLGADAHAHQRAERDESLADSEGHGSGGDRACSPSYVRADALYSASQHETCTLSFAQRGSPAWLSLAWVSALTDVIRAVVGSIEMAPVRQSLDRAGAVIVRGERQVRQRCTCCHTPRHAHMNSTYERAH
jgi:hypothetical protein